MPGACPPSPGSGRGPGPVQVCFPGLLSAAGGASSKLLSGCKPSLPPISPCNRVLWFIRLKGSKMKQSTGLSGGAAGGAMGAAGGQGLPGSAADRLPRGSRCPCSAPLLPWFSPNSFSLLSLPFSDSRVCCSKASTEPGLCWWPVGLSPPSRPVTPRCWHGEQPSPASNTLCGLLLQQLNPPAPEVLR